jgi:radical SAM superfamily enzyme YgiQ (UPF0313 family)
MRVLLLNPEFPEKSFWNAKAVCRMAGRKHSLPPLGLATVAALLPREWDVRIVDLNCGPVRDGEIEAADLVMTGGMITQQRRTLEIVARAKRLGTPVAVGGPDPTSQPDVYATADYRVLDEAENTLPAFLEALARGESGGVFRGPDPKPDVTDSPVPRFDLLALEDYFYAAVQFSRGCPHTCEFCDIIELYGRVPRTKGVEQFLAELTALYDAGYRGGVEIVDDNFIGNKREVKPMLRALVRWQDERERPFYFGTEATLMLARDAELLELMRRAGFTRVFVGVETPDPGLLRSTRKRQNTLEPVVDSVRRLHRNGLAVSGGFILGFDGERAGAGAAIVDCVESSNICTAMLGTLTALPNTQLHTRLEREGRLLGGLESSGPSGEIDQMTGGLNFHPDRPRREILAEFRNALRALYSPAAYFGRLRRLLSEYDPNPSGPMRGFSVERLSVLCAIAAAYARRPLALVHAARTLAYAASRGARHFEFAVISAMFYLHLGTQAEHVSSHVEGLLKAIAERGEAFERDLDGTATDSPAVVDTARARS